MRILSWNILNGGRDGRDRLERTLRACKATASDIIILQEACRLASDTELLRWAEDLLGMSSFPGESRSGYHLCVFMNPSLSVKPSVVKEGLHHAAIILSLVLAGDPLTIVGVHLCPDSPTTRQDEVHNLLTHIPRMGPALIIGDFNSPDTATLMAIGDQLPATLARRYTNRHGMSDGILDTLLVRGFYDVAARFGEDGPTFATGGPHVGRFLPMRIDYAAVNGSLADRVTGFSVVRGRDFEQLSDHLPIQVSIGD